VENIFLLLFFQDLEAQETTRRYIHQIKDDLLICTCIPYALFVWLISRRTFLSEQTNHQQPASGTFSLRKKNQHQPSASYRPNKRVISYLEPAVRQFCVLSNHERLAAAAAAARTQQRWKCFAATYVWGKSPSCCCRSRRRQGGGESPALPCICSGVRRHILSMHASLRSISWLGWVACPALPCPRDEKFFSSPHMAATLSLASLLIASPLDGPSDQPIDDAYSIYHRENILLAHFIPFLFLETRYILLLYFVSN
jgi:hypothetical protein